MSVTGALLFILSAFLFKLGSPTAWAHHLGLVLFLLFFSAVGSILVDCTWRLSAALWKACRKSRFREASFVFSLGLLAEMLVGAGIWHSFYIDSPHFILFNEGSFGAATASDYPGAGQGYPVSGIYFERLVLFNEYAPDRTYNWHALAVFPNEEEALGRAVNGQTTIGAISKFQCGPGNLIWRRVQDIFGKQGIGHGNSVDGCAVFAFEGIRQEVLSQPGTVVSIFFNDSHGRCFKHSYVISSEQAKSPYY
jgi:hypothetical protein